MNRRSGTIVALVCALAALAGSSSVSAANGFVPTHKLHVDLTEWAVVPSQGLVSAGRLRLTVANYGVLRHELAIIPTQWWGETLDVHDGRAVGDSLARPIVVAPGQRRALQLELPAGSYVLVDNSRGHYTLGAAVSILAA